MIVACGGGMVEVMVAVDVVTEVMGWVLAGGPDGMAAMASSREAARLRTLLVAVCRVTSGVVAGAAAGVVAGAAAGATVGAAVVAAAGTTGLVTVVASRVAVGLSAAMIAAVEMLGGVVIEVVMLVDVMDDSGVVDDGVVVDGALVGTGMPNLTRKPWVIFSRRSLGGVGWMVLDILFSW